MLQHDHLNSTLLLLLHWRLEGMQLHRRPLSLSELLYALTTPVVAATQQAEASRPP